MRRPVLTLALCALSLGTGAAQAADSVSLDAVMAQLGSAEASLAREAAFAACLLLAPEQKALMAAFEASGWQGEGFDGGAFGYHFAGDEPGRLQVTLYEGDSSCLVLDRAAGTTAAHESLTQMLRAADLQPEPIADMPADSCAPERVSLPTAGTDLAASFTLQVVSGADYSACASETASAVLIELED